MLVVILVLLVLNIGSLLLIMLIVGSLVVGQGFSLMVVPRGKSWFLSFLKNGSDFSGIKC